MQHTLTRFLSFPGARDVGSWTFEQCGAEHRHRLRHRGPHFVTAQPDGKALTKVKEHDDIASLAFTILEDHSGRPVAERNERPLSA